MTDFLWWRYPHQMMGELPRPRLMFRKGIGMRGYFKPYRSFREYTCAEIFCEADQSFAVRARFSALLGDGGTADTRRNIKGFAVRFRSGQASMTWCVRACRCFLSIRAAIFRRWRRRCAAEPGSTGFQPERFWRFVVNHPESLHCALRLFSVEGSAASYRICSWYSVHTFVWINEKKERFLVRYQWKPVELDRTSLCGTASRRPRAGGVFIGIRSRCGRR